MTEIDLPYTRHSLSQADIDAVVSALKSPSLTQGPMVGKFEEAFAEFVGAKYAVACSSGTAALHMAYAVAGASKDRPVVTSPITFVATANAARACGAKVGFGQTDPTTGLLSSMTFAYDVAAQASLLVPVHLGGHVCDMRLLAAYANTYGWPIVEDASHAFGALYLADGHWHQVGACHHSLMCCFSLHPAKHITSGEGGVITTNDELCVKELRRWRSHGRDDQGWQQSFGWNYRMTDFQAALALSQLSRARGMLARRRRLADLYDTLLDAVPVEKPVRPPWSHGSWHLYAIRVAPERRAELRGTLGSLGIGAQVHYRPVWSHPYWGGRDERHAYADRCLSLPMFPEMSEADVGRVVDALMDFEW